MANARKRAIILRAMLHRLFRQRQFAGTLARLLACTALLMLPASASVAHEADAEEIALSSLVDAEFAFARMAHEASEHDAFVADFAADGIVFQPAPVRLQ